MKELHQWNFIVYSPSKNPTTGSSVVFVSPEHRNRDPTLAGHAKDKRLSLKEKNRGPQGGTIVEQAHPRKEQKGSNRRNPDPL